MDFIKIIWDQYSCLESPMDSMRRQNDRILKEELPRLLGGIGGRRRRGRQWWDGWMASPTQWAWVWVNSQSWWWTGRPGMLRFMGSQRVGHDWATELNWTEDCQVTASITDRDFGRKKKNWLHLLRRLSSYNFNEVHRILILIQCDE